MPQGTRRPRTGPERRDVSVILPVMDETWSLRRTVEVLHAENEPDLKEILIVSSKRTTPESLGVIETLRQSYPALVRTHEQRKPQLGGALQEAFELSRGDYTILMASDLETDPSTVSALIAAVRSHGVDIVIASRWLGGRGRFEHYGRLKRGLNRIFQCTFALLFGVRLTDLTYAFRIYRTSVLRDVTWSETTHSFLLESLLRPLRMGCTAMEVPASWTARREGRTHNRASSYFRYFLVGLRTLAWNPRRSAGVTERTTP